MQRNTTTTCHLILSPRRASQFAGAATALLASLMASTAWAATCQFIGGPQFGGLEPPLAVDADCTDPDYNEKTLAIESTEQKTLKLPDGSSIGYTEVKARFPATRTKDELPSGITESQRQRATESSGGFPKKLIGTTASSSSRTLYPSKF